MRNQDTFKRQAEANELSAIKAQQDNPDWAIIMCFYAALHWINYHAFVNGDMKSLSTGGNLHDLKKDYIQKIGSQMQCPQIEKAYKRLYADSMRARYLKGLEQEDKTSQEYYKTANIAFYLGLLKTIKEKLS